MKNKGFTLIEILIVVSLLGLLLTVILFATNSSNAKARDTERLSNVKEVEKALTMYQLEHGSYPVSSGGDWVGNASDWGGYSDTGPSGYIPNLAPKYISKLPVDPKQENNKGYLYKSNGNEYFFLAYKTLEKIDTPAHLQRPSNPASNDLAIYTAGFADQTVPGEDEIDGEGFNAPPQTPIANLVNGNVYIKPQTLTLSSSPGASIYYTMDGSTPTTSSNLYNSQIILTTSNSFYHFFIKAIAVKNDVSSGIFSGNYIITSGPMPE